MKTLLAECITLMIFFSAERTARTYPASHGHNPFTSSHCGAGSDLPQIILSGNTYCITNCSLAYLSFISPEGAKHPRVAVIKSQYIVGHTII